MMRLITIVFSVLVLMSCSKRDKNFAGEIKITRLDSLLTDGRIDSNDIDVRAAIGALRLVHGDSSLSDKEVVYAYKHSPANEIFGPDVDSIVQDLRSQEGMLGEGIHRLRNIVPDAEVPARIYGYITPYMQSVVIADSVMLVGLNHYLGREYPGYESFEDYKRLLKVQSRIPFDVVEAILYTSYPYEKSPNSTALNRMLYEGAIAVVIGQVFPDADESDILGMTPQQVDWAKNNERVVWQSLVEKELLYSMDPMVISKLVSPSPGTLIVHKDAPGRMGRYMGYKIVQSYLNNHKSVGARRLLKPEFYDSSNVLIEAAYSPN